MKVLLEDGSALVATFDPAHQVQRVSKPLPELRGYASVDFLGNGYATETIFSQRDGFWAQTTYFNGQPSKMVFKDCSYGRVFAYTYDSDGTPSTTITSIPRSADPVNRALMTMPPFSLYTNLQHRPQTLLRRRAKTHAAAQTARAR